MVSLLDFGRRINFWSHSLFLVFLSYWCSCLLIVGSILHYGLYDLTITTRGVVLHNWYFIVVLVSSWESWFLCVDFVLDSCLGSPS